jgi:hypothetical protein
MAGVPRKWLGKEEHGTFGAVCSFLDMGCSIRCYLLSLNAMGKA